jgi:hypothetical protein
MNDATTPAKPALSHRRKAGEPMILVEFLDGPEGDQALHDLVRALGRHMARRLFAPTNRNGAGADASHARDE